MKMVMACVAAAIIIFLNISIILNGGFPPAIRWLHVLVSIVILVKLFQFIVLTKTPAEIKKEREVMSKWQASGKTKCPYCGASVNEDLIKCEKCGSMLPNEMLEKAEQELA